MVFRLSRRLAARFRVGIQIETRGFDKGLPLFDDARLWNRNNEPPALIGERLHLRDDLIPEVPGEYQHVGWRAAITPMLDRFDANMHAGRIAPVFVTAAIENIR